MLKIQRNLGQLTTEQVGKGNNYLTIKAQRGVDLNNREAQKLVLTLFNDGIVRCIGRIQSEESIFIPSESTYATKLCEEQHKEVGHKGVNITMAKVSEKYWVPRWRTIIKKEKKKCKKCKIMVAKPYPEPQRGLLPEKESPQNILFAITGIDFVGSFHFREGKQEMKGYVVVFSCATYMAVYFTATKTMEQKSSLTN